MHNIRKVQAIIWIPRKKNDKHQTHLPNKAGKSNVVIGLGKYYLKGEFGRCRLKNTEAKP